MFSQQTLVAFNRAYSHASYPFDLASAARDIAVTSWKLAMQSVEAANSFKSSQTTIYHFKEAVNFFDKAVAHGVNCTLSEDWLDSLKTSFHECLQDAKVYIGNETDFEKRISMLETFRPLIKTCAESKADLNVEVATQIFRLGVTVLQKGDYKKALYCMKECYTPLEEGRRWAGDQKDILSEINVLQEDIYMNQCKAESLQSRATGDELLEKSIKEEENLNMTAIYEVLDWYKRAILLTRETELEMEAIAQSRLGKVFADVLKVPYKAKEYFVQCIHLAHSMEPRCFHGVDWYQTATKFVEDYQKERLEQETDQWQKERQKYLEELKDELKALEEKHKERYDSGDGNKKFLMFVYNTHPPKRKVKVPKEEEMKTMDKAKVKKLFKSALIHYHPDRNKKNGEKWHTLCEEITKLLTQIYETFKI